MTKVQKYVAGATGIIFYEELSFTPVASDVWGFFVPATIISASSGATLLKLYHTGSKVTATFNSGPPVRAVALNST